MILGNDKAQDASSITATRANGVSTNVQALRLEAPMSLFVVLVLFVMLVPVHGIISKFLPLGNPHCLTGWPGERDYSALRVGRQENTLTVSTCLRTSDRSHRVSQINTSRAWRPRQ